MILLVRDAEMRPSNPLGIVESCKTWPALRECIESRESSFSDASTKKKVRSAAAKNCLKYNGRQSLAAWAWPAEWVS